MDVSPVMGKGFPLAALPVEEVPTLLLFATGSGIAPIRALIDSERLQVRTAECCGFSGWKCLCQPMLRLCSNAAL